MKWLDAHTSVDQVNIDFFFPVLSILYNNEL
jgi:hypothetical protein